MFLKNIFFILFLSLIPFGFLLYPQSLVISVAATFVVLLAIFVLIYHPLICGLRLLHSQKISYKVFWKNFIPFWNDKYWTFLFFNK
jgi:hypothetical protein